MYQRNLMLNNYTESLIRDYIVNINPFEIKTINYLEEYILLSESISSDVDYHYADAVYYLYDVVDINNNSNYYIIVVNENIQMVIKATDQVLSDLFPHILKKNDI